MINAFGQEGRAIILGFVESDNLCYVQVLKDVDIAGSCVAITMNGVSLVYRSHEGQELARDDPVKISVLYLFVVLIFTSVKSLEVVPSMLNSELESLQALEDGAVVVAVAAASVSVVLEVGLVGLELAEGLVGVHLEDDHHERTHQAHCVRHLSHVAALRVVVNACLPLEAVTLEELLQLAAETMGHGEVQRTEVLVEGHVSQILKTRSKVSK